MSPTAMLTLMFAAIAMFSWSASRRWQLTPNRPPRVAPGPPRRAACAERGGTRFDRRKSTITTRRVGPQVHLLRASSSCCSARSSSGAAATTPRSTSSFFSPSTALGQVYEFLKDTWARWSSAARSSSFTTASSSSRSACRSASRGVIILLIIFTMMIADMTYDGASLVLASKAGAFCAGDGPPRNGGPVRGGDDHPRAPRRRGVPGRVVDVARRHGLPLRDVLRRARRRRCSSGSRAAGFWTHATLVAHLPEPASALEALPHHHGDPERLPARPHAARAPRADGGERREADGGGGRRGRERRTRWRCRSASRASSTSRGRRSSTSTRAPSAGAARTTARRTGRARSSARST